MVGEDLPATERCLRIRHFRQPQSLHADAKRRMVPISHPPRLPVSRPS